MPDNAHVVITRPRRKELGRLLSYNQFPAHYANLREMADSPTEGLQHIKDLGFTNVWINPVFESCKNLDFAAAEIKRGLDLERAKGLEIGAKHYKVNSKPGSPYAVHSLNIDERYSSHKGEPADERREKDYDDVRYYTDKARSLGLTPMSDFVIRHVAVDHPLVKEKPHWFKRNPNGTLVFFGRDERQLPGIKSWDDVVEFNYDDPKLRREIVEEYVKPMAKLIIQRFGFQGLRIDTAAKVPPEVYDMVLPYIDALAQKEHGKPAIILGETLARDISNFYRLKGRVDYCYNSIFFAPHDKAYWGQDHNGFAHAKGSLQTFVAPTIGFAGNHDVLRAANYYLNNMDARGDDLRQTMGLAIVTGSLRTDDLVEAVHSLQVKRLMTHEHQGAFAHAALTSGLVTRDQFDKAMTALTKQAAKTEFKSPEEVEKAQLKAPLMLPKRFLHQVLTPENLQSEKGRLFVSAFVDIMMQAIGKNESAKRGWERRFSQLSTPPMDKPELNRKMREAFCFAAFCSDGGWFFSAGDEWGVTKPTNVFTASPDDLKQRAYPDLDYSGFVAKINQTIKTLPSPTEIEWVQRSYLLKDQEIACGQYKELEKLENQLCSFYLHQGNGMGGHNYMVVSNISDEPVELKKQAFERLASANGRNSDPLGASCPHQLFCVGDVKIDPQLRAFCDSRGIEIVETDRRAEVITPKVRSPNHADNIPRGRPPHSSGSFLPPMP